MKPDGQHTKGLHCLHPSSNFYYSFTIKHTKWQLNHLKGRKAPGHMDSGAHFLHLFPEELHETLLVLIGASKPGPGIPSSHGHATSITHPSPQTHKNPPAFGSLGDLEFDPVKFDPAFVIFCARFPSVQPMAPLCKGTMYEKPLPWRALCQLEPKLRACQAWWRLPPGSSPPKNRFGICGAKQPWLCQHGHSIWKLQWKCQQCGKLVWTTEFPSASAVRGLCVADSASSLALATDAATSQQVWNDTRMLVLAVISLAPRYQPVVNQV